MHPAHSLTAMPFAPYRLSGTVVGALLNHSPLLAALGPAVHQAPYKAPPQGPVLYVKPRNTLLAHGGTLLMPAGETALEVGLSLGLVIGTTACRVSVHEAMAHVAGYCVVADVCVPHASVYRPSVRQRAQDGFCPIGPRITPRQEVPDPDHLNFSVRVNGQVVQQGTTGHWVRPAAQLLADVSEFMTLAPGDVLLLGSSAGAPHAGAGTQIELQLGPLAPLHFQLAASATPPEAHP